ncbi:MAG: hypothetical protein KA479_11285 [Saprospiraceae bacterium]|nr:hypothetical protein [Saprospiraceae bacterium]
MRKTLVQDFLLPTISSPLFYHLQNLKNTTANWLLLLDSIKQNEPFTPEANGSL